MHYYYKTECVKFLQFQCKITLGVCKSWSSTQIMREIALFSGKIYTAGTNFTRPQVVTVATNLDSAKANPTYYWSTQQHLLPIFFRLHLSLITIFSHSYSIPATSVDHSLNYLVATRTPLGTTWAIWESLSTQHISWPYSDVANGAHFHLAPHENFGTTTLISFG